MSISERYRLLVADLTATVKQIEDEGSSTRALKVLHTGVELLTEHVESVGEVPRMRIEQHLSPVLLDAHNLLDRGRLLLVEGGAEAHAQRVWEFQQQLYRLLNDL